jgi:hypothetical protein
MKKIFVMKENKTPTKEKAQRTVPRPNTFISRTWKEYADENICRCTHKNLMQIKNVQKGTVSPV